jgi:RNA polymerase sigma-70 factor (ECF subfamily)
MSLVMIRNRASKATTVGYVSSATYAEPEVVSPVLNADDARLAERVAAGDRGALERLFDSYGGAVKSVALRALRNETLAEDVVQDTFLQFWNAPSRYDSRRGSLRTFLLTIAHRRAVDIVRSEVARTRREERPPDPVHHDVEQEVIERDLSEEVRAALALLTDDERAAIELAYYGGLSYVEVARRLGAPEGTVKSRIRSGMRKLSESLEGLER